MGADALLLQLRVSRRMPENTEQQRVSTGVLRELLLMMCLFPGMVQDLRLPWFSSIYATDGAQDLGHGGVKATCGPTLARDLASASRQDDVAFVLSDVAEGNEQNVCTVPLTFKDCQVQSSIPATAPPHACKLEVGALAILVQQLARSTRSHRTRAFCRVDSQPLRFLIIKGRSGAPHFRQGTMRIAALLVAMEIQLHLGYTPLRSNPRDPRSRRLSFVSRIRHEAPHTGCSLRR